MKTSDKYLLVAMASAVVGMIAGVLAGNPALVGLNTGMLVTCGLVWFKWR